MRKWTKKIFVLNIIVQIQIIIIMHLKDISWLICV